MLATEEQYRINEKNQLVINKNVLLSGEWSLSDNHDLCLTLDGTQDTNFGDKIIFDCTLKDANKNSLLVEVTRHEDKELVKTYILGLTGTWQADKYNRLIFKVEKEKGRHDVLTFKNTWIINTTNRLIYEYEKADLIFKKKEKQQLVFKGYWNINKDNRIYYELDNKDQDSCFEFTTGMSVFEKNLIKYKLMIGPGKEEGAISLSGMWRIVPMLGLTFEVDYGNNEIKPISFGAKLKATDTDTLTFKLSNGFEFTLERKFFNDDSQLFIKFSSDEKEAKLQGGVGICF